MAVRVTEELLSFISPKNSLVAIYFCTYFFLFLHMLQCNFWSFLLSHYGDLHKNGAIKFCWHIPFSMHFIHFLFLKIDFVVEWKKIVMMLTQNSPIHWNWITFFSLERSFAIELFYLFSPSFSWNLYWLLLWWFCSILSVYTAEPSSM